LQRSKKHIIEKVHFKINSESLEQAHHLKETISDVLNSIFIPFLEKYVDELFPDWDDPIIRVNQLKLSLTLEDLTKDFSEVTTALRKELDTLMNEVTAAHKTNGERNPVSKNEPTGHQIIQPSERKHEAFFYFLKTGRSPWWLNPKQLDDILDEKQLIVFLNTRKSSLQELIFALKNDLTIRTRFASQFSTSFVMGILLASSDQYTEIQFAENPFFSKCYSSLNGKERGQFITMVLELLENLPNTPIQQKEWKQRLQKFIETVGLSTRNASETARIAYIQNFNKTITSILQSNKLELSVNDTISKEQAVVEDHLVQAAEKIIEKEEEESELLEKGLFIENGGLIILHPFLPHFFQEIGLLDENKQINNPDLAVQVLHYIATGTENPWEHNLLFEKFLCGIPLNDPIDKAASLTSEIKTEIDELFKSLVEHWSVLKNSSPELIRHEFLTRNGKLFRDSVSARLIMERKTPDILLDQLPWGISIVKFPWSTNILYTTW
jgi:hypothetical protein